MKIEKSVLGLVAAISLLLTVTASFSQTQSQNSSETLREAVEALRSEHARTQLRLAALEKQQNEDAPLGPPAKTSRPTFSLSGDVRVRYETNFDMTGLRDRDRAVLRARLRSTYAISDWLAVGGQLATGDPDDPNSTDVTLSNFADDFQVSLDQAYIRITPGNFQVFLGKIPNPFVRTELLWDGDVSPQGASVSYVLPVGGAKLKGSALYFAVDESVAGPDSHMGGAQVSFETAPGALVGEVAVGYFDYSLRSLRGGDPGDFGTNLFTAGKYNSDFNLMDIVAAATWNGLGPQWPLRAVGNYVRNFGAPAGTNTGFGVDLLAGRVGQTGDWRFVYGYAEVEADAVLAAFSHDNTALPTNYLQHALAADYTLRQNLTLNLTYYRYRQKDVGPGLGTFDWQNRIRLNLLVSF